MVTGVRPFKGQYDQALAYEICNQEPEPLTGVRAGVPMEMEFIVGKCLEKASDDRYDHVSEIAKDLRSLGEKLKSGRSTIIGSPVTRLSAVGREHDDAASNRGDRVVKYLPWALAGMAALFGAWVSFLHFGETPARPASFRFTVAPPPGTTFAGHRDAANPTLSPDGRLLAFVAAEEGEPPLVWIRSLGALDAAPLPGTEEARYPFWSPDSRFLGFFSDGKLKKIDIEGGPAQTLCDAPAARGGVWRSAETEEGDLILFAPSNFDGLSVVSADGGEVRSVTKLDPELGHNAHRAPQFLPGGKRFLYMARTDRPESYGVYVGRLDGDAGDGGTERFLDADSGIWYAPPTPWHERGYVLFQRQDTLLAQELDSDGPSTIGRAVPIAERLATLSNLTIGSFSASQNGVLAYETEEAVPSQLTWVDRTGRALSPVGDPGLYRDVSLSPDGETVAVSKKESPQAPADLWLVDLERDGAETRFTFHGTNDAHPVWSPDGKRIAFRTDRATGTPDIFLKAADGARGAEPILQNAEGSFTPMAWTNDGQRLVYHSYSRGPSRLGTLWVAGEREPEPYRETPASDFQAQLSPDGKRLAYSSNESGQLEIYLQDFPVPGGKTQISTEGGDRPRWNPNGNELFYVGLDGRLMSVNLGSGPAAEIESPRPLFAIQTPCGRTREFCYDVSPDGERFLVNALTREPLRTIEVVVNWQAQLPEE